VASVDSKGLVTAKKAGITIIVATAKSNDTQVQKATLVIVSQNIYSASQVAQHDSLDSCWMIINNKVYDVTEFAPIHPGGDILYGDCGNDATTIFKSIHVGGQRLVNLFYIGDVGTSNQNGEQENDDESEHN
jgi:cytochrome b involved in lipid metabolism